MKKYLKYILAFLIPFLTFNVFLITRGITPYGDDSLLVSDLQAQYSVFLSYIRDFNNIFYSLNKGLGGGMYGTFAYYLSSPFNLIIYLFKPENLLTAITIIITLKISISGLTMYTYLKNKLNKNDYILLIFSSCYSLMSYVVNYHFNIMWLDGVMWLPLIMLGIDKLIIRNNSKLYIISLSIAIISNYYIGYMLCIMSVLYFISQMVLKYEFKKNKKEILLKLKKFIISSLLSGMIAMVIIIPAFLELQNSYKMKEAVSYTGFNFNIFDLLSKTYLGSHNYEEILCVNAANIYSGLITLPLIFFYFINKKIDKKEKIVYGILLLILMSGFFINGIDCIWHAFNSVMGFYYRYSFIFCFIIIFLSAKSIYKISNIDKIYYCVFIIIYILVSFIIIFMKYEYLSNANIYISLGCVILYLVLLYLLDKEKDAKTILVILVISELFFNLTTSLKDFVYYDKVTYNYYATEIKQKIKSITNNDLEHRFEENINYTRNEGLFLGYKGITSFISTTNDSAIKFLIDAGYWGFDMTNVDYGKNSILIDSLLSINYRINDKIKLYYEELGEVVLKNYIGLTNIKQINDTYYILKNPYSLNIGYMVNSNIKLNDKNPFELQNSLLNAMTGKNYNYFKKYEVIKKDDYYEVEINNDELVYLYYPFDNKGTCSIYVNESNISSNSEVFIIDNEGENLKLSLTCKKEIEENIPAAYYFDFNLFLKAINNLKNNQATFEIIEDGYIKGTVSVTDNKNILFLNIPYENGWTLYVDGNKTKIEKIYDIFMGTKLSEGQHQFELTYETPGLKLGLFTTFIGLIITIIYLMMEKMNNSN